jgi:hypothetical protein
MRLSDDAKKLLKYFQSLDLGEGEYEYPGPMLSAFRGDTEACERAQDELSTSGFIKLGSPLLRYASTRIRTAALTSKGKCYLERESIE